MRSGAWTGGRSPRSAGFPIGHTIQGVLIAAISGGLLWLIWIYGNGLRDARYLDGWVLACGMTFQLFFHIAIKAGSLAPKSASRWRTMHIFVGYVLIAAFISHSDFGLPDTSFEWALWAGFMLVTLSGIVGAYLAWSLKTKRRIDDSISYERIPALRAELARAVRTAVAEAAEPAASQIVLPGLPPLPGMPHHGWIMDLYTNHLHDFFEGPRNGVAHLIGSQRPLKRLTDEIDMLSRYVDQQSLEKLAAIKTLVIEKDRLDYARVRLGLGRGWLFIHVPVTYALIALSVVHGLIVYSFSSGAW